MRSVNPLMGADLIIVVFAVVVIGGLGSIFGSVAAGFAIGILQSWTVAYEAPELLTQVLVFLIMAAVLLWRPSGLFGREETMA
jgi:branched-chain amino acid transport system permease protein